MYQQTPAAEVPIPESLVAGLIRGQFPAFDGPLRLLANGWDNVIFRLGEDRTVRLPRRAVAVPLLRHEQRWLPVLAALLPVPVPVPLACGEPALGYPWPWTVNRWLPGTAAVHVAPAARTRFAAALGEALAALHVPAPDDAPRSEFRGVPLAARAAPVRQRLADLSCSPRLRALWETSLEAEPWHGPPVWLHGDTHPANIVVADGGDLGGIIDFGDLSAGDPATDLAAGWMVFDPAGRAAFRAAYAARAELSAGTWARARGWALNIGSAILAGSADHPGMAALGRHALHQVGRKP